MYYKDLLLSLIKSEKNPVNKMYLHEIQMKWNKFLEIAEQPKQQNAEMIEALNDFLDKLSSKKFKYNYSSKQGFKSHSDLHQPYYINDLISVIVSKNPILKLKGIIWNFAPFSINLGFNPKDFESIGENPQYVQSYSGIFLQLVQQMDVQMRAIGKKTFHKYKLNLPLIVFHIHKNLTESVFSQCEYSANQAKNTFKKSKSILVAETLATDFIPEIKSSSIDAIFILKKSFSTNNNAKLSVDVVDALEKKINFFLSNKKEIDDFQKSGVIE